MASGFVQRLRLENDMQVECEMKRAGANQIANPNHYFGFGMMTVPAVYRMVTGCTPVQPVCEKATLVGHRLVIQRLEHIPESPRKVLQNVWGDDFWSYAIVKAPGHSVSGTVWEVDAVRRERIKTWEFVGQRWFIDIPRIYVDLKTPRLMKTLCCTERLPVGQRYTVKLPDLKDWHGTRFGDLPLPMDPDLVAEHAQRVFSETI